MNLRKFRLSDLFIYLRFDNPKVDNADNGRFCREERGNIFFFYLYKLYCATYWLCATISPRITSTKIFDWGNRYCHSLRRISWECQDFSLKMWPRRRRNFHYHSLRSDLLRMPNADGLVESPGPIGENHCWTTGRKRCNYGGATSGWLHLAFSDVSTNYTPRVFVCRTREH